jgi:hypothetical protein
VTIFNIPEKSVDFKMSWFCHLEEWMKAELLRFYQNTPKGRRDRPYQRLKGQFLVVLLIYKSSQMMILLLLLMMMMMTTMTMTMLPMTTTINGDNI